VAHVDDADAALFEPADRVEQPLHFVERESRGWLVQQQNLGVERKRLDDLDDLPCGDIEHAHGRPHIKILVELGDQLAGVLVEPRPVDDPWQAARSAVWKDVFGDAEAGDETEFLEDHANPEILRLARIVDLDGLAVDAYLTGIGDIHPGEDVHQG